MRSRDQKEISRGTQVRGVDLHLLSFRTEFSNDQLLI